MYVCQKHKMLLEFNSSTHLNGVHCTVVPHIYFCQYAIFDGMKLLTCRGKLNDFYLCYKLENLKTSNNSYICLPCSLE